MRVAVQILGSTRKRCRQVQYEQILAMLLGPGTIELGLRHSEMTKFNYDTGEMILARRHVEEWVRVDDVHLLTLGLSDAALLAACHGNNSDVELRGTAKLVDARVGALVEAVNVERLAGFPSGRLFLDSVEQALAAALVDGHAVRRPAVRMYRGGLSPTRLRRVTELVHARIEDDLTLNEMAESAGLSTAHFCQMFRKSTGESPHRFVLGQNSRHSSILRECSVVSAERALPNDRHFWFRSNPKEL